MKINNPYIQKNFILILCTLFFTLSVKSQELQRLIEEALANNPEIQQFEMQFTIATEKVNEVNTIPNTEFSTGYFVSEPETRTGAQKAKFSVKQMLPWFGGISARENYATALSDAKYEDVVIAKRKLIASVSQSYYNLITIKDKQDILVINIDLLDTYEALALTSVEVGTASAVDVLKLQMRQNEMEQLQQILEQNYNAEQSLLNNLLNRTTSTNIVLTQELEIPFQDEITNSEDLVVHPELTKYDKIYHSVEQSELLNQKDAAPMIGFGLDYVIVQERPDMNFNDNGKDIFMPMVSLSIPVFNKKYNSKTKQNKLKQEEISFQKQDRKNKLKTALDKAISERNSAKISFNTQTKNLVQANNAEDILMKGYESGMLDFTQVLDIQELQLKFQMNQIEATKNYFIQSSIINYLSHHRND
ncbi:TolC family protein [Urechidicola vernalis]|uniref:TolC family protein n=1 Tax=Urechidicola vernalis TaxID=3075600 RepID=A0ABU2Y2F4_9FLAO|nr:TolC family protein [Urechidicola sp. P050]MDT0551819.1 TolC family protein [Urechidicola sp. P050]